MLGSLAPPPGQPDAETMRDSVSTTVSGILGLLGIDADPIKSREHILLSTIIGLLVAGRAARSTCPG